MLDSLAKAAQAVHSLDRLDGSCLSAEPLPHDPPCGVGRAEKPCAPLGQDGAIRGSEGGILHGRLRTRERTFQLPFQGGNGGPAASKERVDG
jgi:hypothetical protein